jgi:hypothetical protein
VSGLLPHVIQHAVSSKSVYLSSQSFGLVTLTLLVVLLLDLLLEREALRVGRFQPARRIALSAFSVPLLMAFALTIAARIALLIH